MKRIENIAKEMGYTTKPGIGSDHEIFVYDENGNSVACVLVGDELSVVSNKDIETEQNPEFFTADINDKDATIVAIEYGMSKDRSFN